MQSAFFICFFILVSFLFRVLLSAKPLIWTGQSIQKLERTKETFIKNYDVDHPMKTNTVIQKMKNTFKEKYGNENIVNVPKIKEKIKISRLNSTYESILIRFKDYVIPSFSKNEFKGVGYYDVKYKWKCVKCGNEFFDTCYSNIPRCEKCYPKKQSSSLSEMKFIEFIKSLTTLKIETSNRSLISPLELDVVIPEKKLAFEFNGIYWHSDKFIKTRDYHLNKTMMCEKIGYKLIHIWEYHWDHKQDILKDKLKSIFNIFDKKISAHKCNVEKLTENEKIIFLNTNSLNGNDKSDILYGLKYNDEIVSIMTLTKLIENNYEIVSYCSKLGHKIFGGGTKLLKYFENEYRPQSIVTKCDISYNFTTFYEKLGFHLKEKTQPNHHLIKDQIIFEDDLKNKNLINNELLKIWDCGNFIYEKTY